MLYTKHSIEPENRIQLAYKRKREQFVTPNIPNSGYPGQSIKVNIPRGSSDITMVRKIQQLTFSLDLELSKDKARSIVNNIGRAIVSKKTLFLGSEELEVIENSDIFDLYNDLYLTKKQQKNMHLHGIDSKNRLKARVGAKKAVETDLTINGKENAILKTLENRFFIPLNFKFSSSQLPHTLQR